MICVIAQVIPNLLSSVHGLLHYIFDYFPKIRKLHFGGWVPLQGKGNSHMNDLSVIGQVIPNLLMYPHDFISLIVCPKIKKNCIWGLDPPFNGVVIAT